jgi:hypothetical protein
MNESDNSKVDALSQTLYSRTRYQNPLDKRSEVKSLETPEVEEKWQGPALNEILTRERLPEPTHPFLKKFFVFAVLFFVATILVAGFVFLGGVNFVSSKNVDIEVVGPTLASAGQKIELGVTIENGNNTDLELANLSVQYPQGSRDADNTGETLTYEREELGIIQAGDEAVRNIDMVLLGSTGEAKEIKFIVEYKVKGSNATFYKEKVYLITIGNSPVTLNVQGPGRVTAGENFTTQVSVTLNSTEVLKNVMLKAEYPYGYSVTDATPQSVADGNLWALGDLSPGATKKISIRGKLSGENQEERTFRFYLGVSDSGSLSPNFKTILLSDQETVGIQRPAVGLTVLFNGENTLSYVAPAGRPITAQVRVQNNLPEKIINPRLEAKLSGTALNRDTVAAQNNGVYNKTNGTLSWSIVNSTGVSELAPGESGTVIFVFSSLADLNLIGSSQDIGLQFNLTGFPVGGSSQSLSVSDSRTVKIASQVTLGARAVYSIGPFTNTGPTPPKAGATTTYSVVWTASNTQNSVPNAKVTAKLGTNVKWVIAKSLMSEDISYDAKTNTVTWNLGELQADAGFSTPAREVSFQVSFVPSVSQIGTAPTLVSNIQFTGGDFNNSGTLRVNHPNLTTRMPSDPAFIQGDDIVVK